MKTREKTKREESTEEREESHEIQPQPTEAPSKHGGLWILLIFLVPMILLLVWGYATR